MTKQLESKIAELTAELDTVKAQLARVLATPQILRYVEHHESNEHAKRLAIAEEQRVADERAAYEAKLRKACESEDGRWMAIVIALDSDPNVTSVTVDLGKLGKRASRPGSPVAFLRAVDLESRKKSDKVLADTIAAAYVVVEPAPMDRAMRLEREDRARR